MKENNGNTGFSTRFALGVRLALAVYLLYEVYALREAPGKYDGAEQLFFVAAMVVFVVAALFIGVSSIRALVQGRYVGGAMDVSGAAETAGEGEAEREDAGKEEAGEEESGEEAGEEAAGEEGTGEEETGKETAGEKGKQEE